MHKLVKHKYLIIAIVLMLTSVFLFLCIFSMQLHSKDLYNNTIAMQKNFLKNTVENTVREVQAARDDKVGSINEKLTSMDMGIGEYIEEHLSSKQPNANEFISAVNQFMRVSSFSGLSYVVCDDATGEVIYDPDGVLSPREVVDQFQVAAPQNASGQMRAISQYESYRIYDNGSYSLIYGTTHAYIYSYVKSKLRIQIYNADFYGDTYLWVNRIVSYDGGDDYAIRIIHPNLRDTEGMFLSTDMQDSAGGYPYREELEGIKQDGELFSSYYFKKLNSNDNAQKITYAKIYKDYDWVICMGSYYGDIRGLSLFGASDRSVRIILIALQVIIAISGIMLFALIAKDRSAELALRRQQNDRLEDALDKANAANRAKSAFLSNMSHDIRTPMNAIMGFTELALKHIDDQSAVEKYLEKIQTSGTHLLDLINDVLDMSRIESGKMQIEEAPSDIVEMVSELEDMMRLSCREKNISFTTDVTGVKNWMVICDKLRINQILINCLGNSVKFTDKNGKISLTVAQKDRKDQDSQHLYHDYEFRVKDNGIGMSKEFANHIFEAFERENTSTVSKVQGTGLGMSIVKKLVDMMHGTIEVKTAKGEGTELIITLPLKVFGEGSNSASEISDFERSLPAYQVKDINSSSSKRLEGRSILLVEDNELNMEIIETILVEAGAKIQKAMDGSEAVAIVEAAQAGDFDMILMDIQMPIMDGYSATKAIRAMDQEWTHKIPIIAMTANAFAEDVQRAKESGMNAHVAKPINVQDLFAKLDRWKME